MRVVELFDQARQQRFADVDSRGHHRQEVRFVGDHQMRVVVQHGCFEGYPRLGGDLTEVMHAHAEPIRAFGLDRTAVGVEHDAAVHPIAPLLAVDPWKARAQRIEHPSTSRRAVDAPCWPARR